MYRLFNVLRAILLGQTSQYKEEGESNAVPNAVETPPPIMNTIITPIHDTVNVYNIYRSKSGWELLEEKSEIKLHGLFTESTVVSSGAINELNALFSYLDHADIENYIFRIYKVQGHLVLCANDVVNESFEWFYSTLLDLPEGRFNPIVATYKKPAKSKQKRELEYWVDHSKSDEGERG